MARKRSEAVQSADEGNSSEAHKSPLCVALLVDISVPVVAQVAVMQAVRMPI